MGNAPARLGVLVAFPCSSRLGLADPPRRPGSDEPMSVDLPDATEPGMRRAAFETLDEAWRLGVRHFDAARSYAVPGSKGSACRSLRATRASSFGSGAVGGRSLHPLFQPSESCLHFSTTSSVAYDTFLADLPSKGVITNHGSYRCRYASWHRRRE